MRGGEKENSNGKYTEKKENDTKILNNASNTNYNLQINNKSNTQNVVNYNNTNGNSNNNINYNPVPVSTPAVLLSFNSILFNHNPII